MFKHSRPYHPQTCGKVERFHQTLKLYLAKQPPAATIGRLQHQLDAFRRIYNHERPHRSLGRRTPRDAYDARDKARPAAPKITIAADTRVRHDLVGTNGSITLRYKTKLHHIGIGRDHRGKRVIVLRAGLDIRILTPDGELLRQLALDPNRTYHGTGRPPGPPKGRPLGKKNRATVYDGPTQRSCPETSQGAPSGTAFEPAPSISAALAGPRTSRWPELGHLTLTGQLKTLARGA